MVNVDKALIVGDFNIHVDNTNDVLGLAFTDLINSFGVKQNVTGPTHRFNHMLDLIILHGIDLTDIDIIPQSDDVTDHFLVSCMLHITDINYMAPRYRPGRIIVPATKHRFTNNLPDLSQLLCVPINTDELDPVQPICTFSCTSVFILIFINPQYTVLHILSHCTSYSLFYFIICSYFSFSPIFIYIFSCVMFHCFIAFYVGFFFFCTFH